MEQTNEKDGSIADHFASSTMKKDNVGGNQGCGPVEWIKKKVESFKTKSPELFSFATGAIHTSKLETLDESETSLSLDPLFSPFFFFFFFFRGEKQIEIYEDRTNTLSLSHRL